MALEDDLQELFEGPGNFETRFLSLPSLEDDGLLRPGPEGDLEAKLIGPHGGEVEVATRHAAVAGDPTRTARYFESTYRPDPEGDRSVSHTIARNRQSVGVGLMTRRFAQERDDALAHHLERSSRARTVDEQKRASQRTTNYETWARNPRRWDYVGVDTPPD